MIVGVAWKVGETVYSLPKPARHGTFFREPQFAEVDFVGALGGFVTDQGIFLERIPAKLHALECGQITSTNFNELFSEDVW